MDAIKPKATHRHFQQPAQSFFLSSLDPLSILANFADMLFPAVAALLASLLFTQSAIASLTPTDVITNIKIVTTVSNNLNIYLGDLTVNSDSGTVETFATASSVNPLMIRALTGLQRLEQDSKTIISDLTTDATAQDATPHILIRKLSLSWAPWTT